MWLLRYEQRPWTLNAERTWHHHKRAKFVKEWRDAFCELAQTIQIPKLETFSVVATPYLEGRGRIQDVAGCIPAVKAAIDGLVDAGIVPDDGPKYLLSMSFRAPVVKQGNALELVVFPGDVHAAIGRLPGVGSSMDH
jgi:hypothetical protein